MAWYPYRSRIGVNLHSLHLYPYQPTRRERRTLEVPTQLRLRTSPPHRRIHTIRVRCRSLAHAPMSACVTPLRRLLLHLARLPLRPRYRSATCQSFVTARRLWHRYHKTRDNRSQDTRHVHTHHSAQKHESTVRVATHIQLHEDDTHIQHVNYNSVVSCPAPAAASNWQSLCGMGRSRHRS